MINWWTVRALCVKFYTKLGFSQDRVDDAMDQMWLLNRKRLMGFEPNPKIPADVLSHITKNNLKKLKEVLNESNNQDKGRTETL